MGKYGIRIENCYEIVSSGTGPKPGNRKFLTFKVRHLMGLATKTALQTLTLVPMQTSIINKTLLAENELRWLNDYHARVLKEVGPLLKEEGKEEVYEWLVEACRPI